MGVTSPAVAAIAGGTLDPTTVTKYATPLVIPPAMPYTAGTNTDYYEIAVRQFQQQILPAGMPATTVWSYGSTNPAGVFNYPAFTIEATVNRPVQVKWINDLTDGAGNCLPHLLPVDQTVHWANPAGPRDSRGISNAPYTGPVPMVTHVHGAETNQESDGFPEAWYLPNCTIPAGINFTQGSLYNSLKSTSAVGSLWGPGSVVFTYPNAQRASTLWYHDHSMGMTRLNVYAGPAGFYHLRGGPSDQVTDTVSMTTGTLPGPAPMPGSAGGPYYEIPIAIQDRSFNADGSLFYPDNRAFFEGVTPAQLQIPFIPAATIDGPVSDVSPIWNPEFFGNTMVVNGNTWPALQVEQRRYRFRLLNGMQSRFLILTTDTTNSSNNAMTPALTFWQIGAEGGFLPAPVSQTALLIGPAERADVIVDFTNIPIGTNINLLNIAPDEPYGGGIPYFGCLTDPAAPAGCFEPSDPGTTGQVMQFQIVAATGTDTSTPPTQLGLPARTPLPAPSVTRYVSLNEQMSMTVCVSGDPVTGAYFIPITEVSCATDPTAVVFGPAEARLGTFDPVTLLPTHLEWMNQLTETPLTGATEIWEIWNFTADAHPIHIHQVQFEVLGRALQSDPTGSVGVSVAGSNFPLPWETGTKDTIIVYPGELARVKASFPSPGLTVWHCHILEHEDNEMMRPYCIANANGILPKACKVLNRKKNVGVYRTDRWFLDISENKVWNAGLDKIVRFGAAGDTPVAGDWNGDGSTEVGVFVSGGIWRLDTNGNGIWEPGVDAEITYGIAGDLPIVGDWDGNGTTEVGVFRNGTWFLDMNGNRVLDGMDTTFTFGRTGDIPVSGDWMGDGMTKVGVFRSGYWYLDTDGNGIWNKLIDTQFRFGMAGDIPVTGDWTGDRMGTKVGVFRGSGYWYLDTNGNGAWNKGVDLTFKFGIAGDKPAIGTW